MKCHKYFAVNKIVFVGLLVPPATKLIVGSQSHTWNEGCCIFFDDSFLHSTVHTGEKDPRIVLIVDLWHPEVTMKERDALNYLF